MCTLIPGWCQVCELMYQEHAPSFLQGMHFPEDVCKGMDMSTHLHVEK